MGRLQIMCKSQSDMDSSPTEVSNVFVIGYKALQKAWIMLVLQS